MRPPAPGQRIEGVAVVGASGLIGTKVVGKLRTHGHRVIEVSRGRGVDVLAPGGLDAALGRVSVIVDVTNTSTNADTDPLTFFTTATANLVAVAKRLGVDHHVVLSIVGTPRLAAGEASGGSEAGYFGAKQAQEDLVRASGIPFTIVRSTQFFEFVATIADASTYDGNVRLPSTWLQPVAADDVARTIVGVVEAGPTNATVEFAGPERFTFAEVVEMVLDTGNDPRHVVTDPTATYFGVPIERDTLLPRTTPDLGVITLREWIRANALDTE